eukprot:358956-Chlamydomonas_euryale.AAC.1
MALFQGSHDQYCNHGQARAAAATVRDHEGEGRCSPAGPAEHSAGTHAARHAGRHASSAFLYEDAYQETTKKR